MHYRTTPINKICEFVDKRNEKRNNSDCPLNCCRCPAFNCPRCYANCCNDCHRTDCLRYLGLICCCCSLVIDLISGSD
uniref:Uncharacterized protein n=1 Tax=Meloidogyne enterolobii TaxID=390850 RepID=A0A6V7THS3_MELEN|nr:unnamed protein product [Meloidogyne enterolobii]